MKLSDEETLKAIDFAASIPDNANDKEYKNYKNARREILDAIAKLRANHNYAKEK